MKHLNGSTFHQKQLFFERMDELCARPVMSYIVYEDDYGYHAFCDQAKVGNSWSSAPCSGESIIGLFAASFIDVARDAKASLYSEVKPAL